MSKKGGSFLGQQGHSKLAIASLFEAIYIYIFNQRRFGTLTISVIAPRSSYFTVQREEITVKTSWFLKYEITGYVLNISVQ